MNREPLQTNSISTLIINDLVENSEGVTTSITLHRRLPEPAKGYRTLQPSTRPDGPPKRLPSTLPPAGSLRLTLSLKDLLGDGRCGAVYATSLRCLDDSDDSLAFSIPEPGVPFLPQLVAKMADQARLEDIAREASIYDEMESLQGVAVPICYGWFYAELESGSDYTLLPSSNDVGNLNGGKPAKPIPNLVISVLLLERMGPCLPLGKQITDRTEIWAIFSDLSQLGIDQPDMRYSNILLSPSSHTDSNPNIPELPPKICPYHLRTHKYRAIDFDRARKVDWTLKQHHYAHYGTLGRLLEMMELGVILEPWEY